MGEIYQDNEERPYVILNFETAESTNKAKEEIMDKKLNDSDETELYVDFKLSLMSNF